MVTSRRQITRRAGLMATETWTPRSDLPFRLNTVVVDGVLEVAMAAMAAMAAKPPPSLGPKKKTQKIKSQCRHMQHAR